MNQRTLAFGASVLLCCLLLAGAVLAAPDAHSVDRWVIGGGGGRLGDAPLSLEGTIGQPLVGIAIEAPHEVSSGFWFEIWAGEYWVYLPLAVREY
jgi:hypothetical protein